MTKKDNIFIDWIKKVGAGIGGGIAGLAAILHSINHIHLPVGGKSIREIDKIQIPTDLRPRRVTGSAPYFDHPLLREIKPRDNVHQPGPIIGHIPNLSQLPHNKEAKVIQADVVKILATEFSLEIQRINTQAQNLSPTEQIQFLKQSHETLRGEIRKKAVSFAEKENEKHQNILGVSEVSIVATSAVSKVLKANNIPESEDKDNNNNV